MERIVTDSLGFALTVQIEVRGMDGRGQHRTYENNSGVAADATHTIAISPEMGGGELVEVAAHEAYHLFYAVRDHITVDEETQATVFGQLVKRIVTVATAKQDFGPTMPMNPAPCRLDCVATDGCKVGLETVQPNDKI